jgi:hypothetical protein
MSESSESIADRVRRAGPEGPGVSMEEVGRELARFADSGDDQGARDLFDAFYTQERQHATDNNPDQTRARILGNLYFAAQLADCVRIAGGDYETALGVTYARNPSIEGHAAVFFRGVLDYQPPH